MHSIRTKGRDHKGNAIRHRDVWSEVLAIKDLQSYGSTSDWIKDIQAPRPESLRYLGELLLCAMHTDSAPFSKNNSVLQIIREKKLNGLEVFKWLKENGYLTKTEKLSASGRKRLKEIILVRAGELTRPRTELIHRYIMRPLRLASPSRR